MMVDGKKSVLKEAVKEAVISFRLLDDRDKIGFVFYYFVKQK